MAHPHHGPWITIPLARFRELEKAEREHTPPELARWLVDLARRCKPANAEVTGLRRTEER